MHDKLPSCGLAIVSHGASPNDPPDAYEGVRCGSFMADAIKGLALVCAGQVPQDGRKDGA